MAKCVLDLSAVWLATAKAPLFLWVHFYDPHYPYEPPAEFRRPGARGAYHGEVAYVDAQVGKLVAGLRAAQLLDGTAVAVIADHGESLGEHGESTHGVFLYDPTIHVPLLLKRPAGRDAGRRVAARVSAVDLAPTLLEIAGVTAPPAIQGQSLLALASAPRAADRPAYAETDYPRRAFGWSSLAAWRGDRFLYVKAPRRELYDLAADPAAAHNVAEERKAVADGVARTLEEFRRRTASDGSGSAAPALDPQLAEKLASLGYVSTGAVAPSATGIDPKDKVAVANTLHDAILSLENGETSRAGALLERVIATDPQIPMAQLQLGVARCRERKYAQAIAPLRRAIELQPDAVMAHYEMGIALFETGDWKTAAGHFEIVAAKLPKFADARFSLGSVYARIDRVGEAVAELKAALELEPRHYRANLLLGRILTLQGQAVSGLPYLQRAAEAQPSSAEAQAFLADAYQALGQAADAARARERAQRLRKP